MFAGGTSPSCAPDGLALRDALPDMDKSNQESAEPRGRRLDPIYHPGEDGVIIVYAGNLFIRDERERMA
jgi:hypothetical protein